MPSSTFSYTSADGTQIAAYRWDPAGPPRAAIQLTHGLAMAGEVRGTLVPLERVFLPCG